MDRPNWVNGSSESDESGELDESDESEESEASNPSSRVVVQDEGLGYPRLDKGVQALLPHIEDRQRKLVV